MSMNFSDLQCREVICVSTVPRLGFISDVQLDIPDGTVSAIVVPGPCRILGIAGRHEDFIIPWSCIKKIGPDIVLVDTKPNDCRVPRKKLL